MTISIGAILILVLLGAILIALELFYIPGTTIVGLCGVAAAGSGIYYTYHSYGSLYGHTILGISIALNCLGLLYPFDSFQPLPRLIFACDHFIHYDAD